MFVYVSSEASVRVEKALERGKVYLRELMFDLSSSESIITFM